LFEVFVEDHNDQSARSCGLMELMEPDAVDFVEWIPSTTPPWME
jgi:hypothetical protein